MKTCTQCRTIRDLSEFPSVPKASDGRGSACKACMAEYQRNYRKANSKTLLAKKAEYYVKNRERITEYQNAYRSNNPDANRNYLARTKEKVSMRKAKWRNDNLEAIKSALAERMASDPERYRLYFAGWRARNKHRVTAAGARRRARHLQATPKWSDPNKAAAFYESAHALRMLLGEWYEVDHIVPLQGENVCGLHNEFNLQILTMTENRRKSNRHD